MVARWDMGSTGGSSEPEPEPEPPEDDPNRIDLGQASSGGLEYDAAKSEASAIDADSSSPGGAQVYVTDGDEGSESNQAQQEVTDAIVNATGGTDTTVSSPSNGTDTPGGTVDATDPVESARTAASGGDNPEDAARLAADAVAGSSTAWVGPVLAFLAVLAAAGAAFAGGGD